MSPAQLPLTELIELPANMNPGLSPARQSTMLSLVGNPRSAYTQECQPVTNPRLRALMVTADVGPFSVTGLRPAIESLKAVIAEIRQEQPDVYQALGTAGMLCVRLVRGSTMSISNHSWGTAIDLKVNGTLDPVGNQKVPVGLKKIAHIFNRHGWYWGAAFGGKREDAMHFEVSDEKIREWHRQGKFNNAPSSQPEAVLSLGDRGPEVKALQELLNKWGTKLAVDGVFGRNSLAAVMAFQGEKGLKVDGVVGKRTWAALRA